MEPSADQSLVQIFADESCLGNQFQDRGRPGAAAGMLERFDERTGWHRRDYYASEPDTTNNRMALVSAILGLGALRRACAVVFVSDSQYLVRGMKEWVHSWVRRGWRRRGGPIENLDLWKELIHVAGRHEVEWRWVRGHAGHAKNEYANMLAVRAAKGQEQSKGLVPSGFEEWIGEQIDSGSFQDFLDLPPNETFVPDPAPPEA
jgi:ribonuclease HI